MLRLALPLLLLGTAGCAVTRVPLSEGLVRRLGPEEFRRLQCYVSTEIVLRRVEESEGRTVQSDNTLQIEKGRRVEEIPISGSTPGCYLEPEIRGDTSDRLLYGGVEYGSAGENRWAHLEIDKDTDRDVEYESRRLPGRRIADEPPK